MPPIPHGQKSQRSSLRGDPSAKATGAPEPSQTRIVVEQRKPSPAPVAESATDAPPAQEAGGRMMSSAVVAGQSGRTKDGRLRASFGRPKGERSMLSHPAFPSCSMCRCAVRFVVAPPRRFARRSPLRLTTFTSGQRSIIAAPIAVAQPLSGIVRAGLAMAVEART